MNQFANQLFSALERHDTRVRIMTNNDFDFDLAVFSYYMKNGKPCTAKELSEDCGQSITKVRKAISDSKYNSENVTVERPVREKSCNTIRCYRRVDAYQPCLLRMREELTELRNKCKGF